MFGGGKHAGFGTAEDAVAVAGYDAVSAVAEGARDKLKRPACQAAEHVPACSQLLEDENDGVGTRQQTFVRKVVTEYYVNRVEICWICAMPNQNPPRQRTLQRREPEDGVRVAAQNELHEAIAQAADAVVEEDGVGHGLRAG
jgi:hypothetical protein